MPAEASDFPGFVSNRILMPFVNEAAYALMEGVAEAEAIDTIAKLGFAHPMGPLALADLIGLDTCVAIMEVLHAGLGDPKYAPCPLLRRYVAAGRLGRKSGRGFYEYDRSRAGDGHPLGVIRPQRVYAGTLSRAPGAAYDTVPAFSSASSVSSCVSRTEVLNDENAPVDVIASEMAAAVMLSGDSISAKPSSSPNAYQRCSRLAPDSLSIRRTVSSRFSGLLTSAAQDSGV